MATRQPAAVAATAVECQVLGPVGVVAGGDPVQLGGYRQRLVLALLASRVGEPASMDWLVDSVWTGAPPRTARRTLQVYITRLRSLLGKDSIATSSDGYRLAIPPDHVDAVRFEKLAERGSALLGTDAAAASQVLTEALDLWRGPAYGDLGDVDALIPVVRRLHEVKQQTVERCLEAGLATGQASTLLPQIDELVVRFPLRERLRGLQMRALYQTGRQADALQAFAAARDELVDTLGVEPAPELRQLHEQILRQDPALDVEATPTPAQWATSQAVAQDASRPPLPSGYVTFVICDIEASTRLFRRVPEEYPRLLARQRQLLTDAFTHHGGVVVNVEGDGTFAAFPDAASALRGCAAAQKALAAEPWPEAVELRVRMGAHSGLASPKDGDYVAMAVHQTERIADAAHGGQVLVSAETAAAVRDVPDVLLEEIGSYRIRDFDRAEPLSQLVVPGVERRLLAPRALPAQGHNLTRPPTSFVGRESDFSRLQDQLQPGALVTLAGPGGVGKSRLAVEVGIAVAGQWPDGVWRVGVDGLPEAALLTMATADAVGLDLPPEERDDTLLTTLQDRQTLLILDGCERHLDSAARLVSRLLATPTRSGVLATSQEPLHVRGERVQRLRPLETGATTADADDVARSPAVQLFVDRAQAVQSEFRLDDQNAAAVAEIVRRLDGLPLAEEIVAARAGAFTPAELLESIERSTHLLQSKDPSLPDRQRTMESLLAWSEGLLTPMEQATMRRLSVFAGPFTLAQAVVAGSGPDADADFIPDHVWSLVDHSIVMADPSAGGTRYRMLDLVRRFAEQRLIDQGEEYDTALRVGRMFVADVGPQHASSRGWISAVGTDLESIRAVIRWLFRSTEPSAVDVAGELAIVITRYLEGVQAYRVAIDEAQGWLDAIPPRPVRVALLAALAMLHLRADEVDTARRLATEARDLEKQSGAPDWAQFSADRALGEVAIRSGRPDEAIAIAQQALGSEPNARARARLYSMLGRALVQRGQLDAAAEAYHGELTACRDLGDDILTSWAHANAAEISLRLGRLTEAAEHQLACLGLAIALGQPVYVAYSAIVAAQVSVDDDPGAVVRLVTKAVDVLDDAQHSLYADDADEVAALLQKARDTLPEEEYRRCTRRAQEMDLDELAEDADAVLGHFLDAAQSNGGGASERRRPNPRGVQPKRRRRDSTRSSND
jgi:predicted ATPase/DNA-binding SARP family transcriptional activator